MSDENTDISDISQEELVERMNLIWNSIHESFVPIADSEVANFQEFDSLMLELSKRNR